MELELYIHIPFCVKKCGYCAFLSAPAMPGQKEAYTEALTAEIRAAAQMISGDHEVVSVFLGGGTPSLLETAQISRILTTLRHSFAFRKDAEITMEANPGTLSGEKLEACRTGGVNRLSLGLQSPKDPELKSLGRIHDFRQFRECFLAARSAGFDNINVDLMYAIPGQTPEGWAENLKIIASMKPEHISAYGLMIEEGTPFWKQAERGELELPDEEAEYRMYDDAGEILSSFGYRQYEISNYSLPGKECRHNIGYWTRKEYLGFGTGAASLFRHCRFSNTSSIREYLEESGDSRRIRRDFEILSPEDEMEEFMFLGLRMTKGVSKADFLREFGRPLEDIYEKVLKKYIAAGLLKDDGDRIFLTRPGIHISNTVMADFLL